MKSLLLIATLSLTGNVFAKTGAEILAERLQTPGYELRMGGDEEGNDREGTCIFAFFHRNLVDLYSGEFVGTRLEGTIVSRIEGYDESYVESSPSKLEIKNANTLVFGKLKKITIKTDNEGNPIQVSARSNYIPFKKVQCTL